VYMTATSSPSGPTERSVSDARPTLELTVTLTVTDSPAESEPPEGEMARSPAGAGLPML